jgi:hypothetical protein
MEPTLVCVRDLMFSSKIMATARHLNAPIEMVREPGLLSGKPGVRLIVDLNQPGTIAAAKQWKSEAAGRTAIGFVSHVDSDTIADARAAGIDQVLARSQFVNALPSLLLSPE